MAPVLVDTSIWVDYLRQGSTADQSALRELMKEGQAATCGVVKAELLQGLRPGEDPLVQVLLSKLPNLETIEDDFLKAGELGRGLVKSGQKPAFGDALIAAVALRHGVSVLSSDKIFARFPGLKLQVP